MSLCKGTLVRGKPAGNPAYSIHPFTLPMLHTFKDNKIKTKDTKRDKKKPKQCKKKLGQTYAKSIRIEMDDDDHNGLRLCDYSTCNTVAV